MCRVVGNDISELKHGYRLAFLDVEGYKEWYFKTFKRPFEHYDFYLSGVFYVYRSEYNKRLGLRLNTTMNIHSRNVVRIPDMFMNSIVRWKNPKQPTNYIQCSR